MPITFKKGDLFDEPAEALVNTVNCVGVMGKGVALEFKRRWPENFRGYKRLCEGKLLRPGSLYVHELSDLFGGVEPRFVINLPTKDHWRGQSKLEYVESGLQALVEALKRHRISSVALPPLGCGNGGLSWEDVRPLIEKHLRGLSDVRVTVLEPVESRERPEHRTPAFPMTYPRAVMLRAFGELEIYFDGCFDRISLQKLVYFLQVLGVPFGLSFKRNLFGPYSEALRKALLTLERHELISGFTSEQRLTRVTPAGYALADEYLSSAERAEVAQQAIGRLSNLIEGYEGPSGLELLSSVHHLSADDKGGGVDGVVKAMAEWNEAKRNRYSPAVVRRAYDRLREDGLLPAG
jgi:O-acetyl-ADP-ribose deacetylase (regulator of RNase III)